MCRITRPSAIKSEMSKIRIKSKFRIDAIIGYSDGNAVKSLNAPIFESGNFPTIYIQLPTSLQLGQVENQSRRPCIETKRELCQDGTTSDPEGAW